MKPRNENSPFNSPSEMLGRGGLLVFLAAVSGAVVFVFLGVALNRVDLLGCGLVALGVAGGLHGWLRRRGRMDTAVTSLSEFLGGAPETNSIHAAEFVHLLQQRDALESKRGSPEFDPWAFQALRHDIRVMVEKDPSLKRLRQD